MTPKEIAKDLVNEKYYQPLTLHLNLNNNSKEMWEYAKRCALIACDLVDLIIFKKEGTHSDVNAFLSEIKDEIRKL